MGRIKSLLIKRTANQLLEGEHNFTDDFEHNKKLLQDIMPSKPTRNRIAGYISRLLKVEKNKLTKKNADEGN
jgi:ribosomal protein S17E